MKFGITSMRHPVQPNAACVSARRYRDTAVSPSDFSIENLVMAWNDGSCPTMVMSVPCSVVSTLMSGRVRREHLARDPRARGVRDGVVHVQQVELVRQHHLVHPHGEREVVRRILEQRIAADVHLVEVDPRQERREPERLLVRDEVDLVAALRERDPQLGRDGARAAIGRVAGDPDLHASHVFHQERARASQSGTRGSRRVTSRPAS